MHCVFALLDTAVTLLTFTTLWADSADDTLMIFYFFFLISHKIDFDISCKLFSQETVCKKSQSLFLGKNKKNISKCRMLFFTQMLSVYVQTKQKS